MKKILFVLHLSFFYAVVSFAQNALTDNKGTDSSKMYEVTVTLADPPPIYGEDYTDESGKRQGKWAIHDAKNSIWVALGFKDDIPSDTIFYYRNDSLKFTYIKSKTGANHYIINDGETACQGYFTLKDISYCANDSVSHKKISYYILYEIFPEFYGGSSALNEYLINRMKKAPKNQKGTVKVDFVIDKAGRPTEVKIHESDNPKLDAFCLRIISEMPGWQAGYQGGAFVSVPLSIPLKFK